MRRLNLGCGPTAAIGWDNIDIEPPTEWGYFGETFDNAQCEIGQFQQADLREWIPTQGDLYDRVEIHHTLMCLYHSENEDLLYWVRHALKPGGVVRVSDFDPIKVMGLWLARRTDELPTAPDVAHPDVRLCRLLCYDGKRRSMYTADSACMLLEKAGFTQVRACLHGGSPLDSRPMESFYVEGTK